MQSNSYTYPCATSAECVTVGLITGDCVLVAEIGATTVGSTAVDVVTAGRDCRQRGMTLLLTMFLNAQQNNYTSCDKST